MPPVVLLLCRAFALVLFGFAAWRSNNQPDWNKGVALGLLLLTASMLVW